MHAGLSRFKKKKTGKTGTNRYNPVNRKKIKISRVKLCMLRHKKKKISGTEFILFY